LRSAVRRDLLAHRGRPLGVRVGMLALVVGVHAALIVPMTFGASAKPTRGQAGAAAASLADEGSGAAIVLLDPASLSKISAPGDVRKANDRTPRFVRFDVSLPPVSGEFDPDPQAQSATADVDGAQRAVLFGRYVNQIVTRIDRAWVRPDTPPAGVSLWAGATADPARAVADARFVCRAKIIQSKTGAVLEVRLLDCDADPKWQQSLVNAIDAASPLPAPPAESVFARSIVVNFVSGATTSETAQQSQER
jgi:hypothetical protein